MVRFALLGCAALGLALSSPAYADDIQDPAVLAPADAAPAAPKVKRPRKLAMLPPARPVEETAELAQAPRAPEVPAAMAGAATPLPAEFRRSTSPSPEPIAEAAPAPVAAAPAVVAAIATLPPLRPSFPTSAGQAAAPAPAAEPLASAAPETGPVPPPRPAVAEVAEPEITVMAVLPPERPAFATDSQAPQVAALQDLEPAAPPPQPQQPRSLFGALFGTPQPAPAAPEPMIRTGRDFLDERIAHHARVNAVPAALVHRVVVRESKYNPRAVGRGGALGLMQIKHATARGLGYDGPASGLLDAETNLTYAVKYLAGAYRLSDGSFDRAVQHYARGYYYEAKRRNGHLALRQRSERLQRQADAAAALEGAAPAAAPTRSLFSTR
jgi:soluble lytic murein transglycosylase-like protein